jgi:preprotein translocase subunit SecA
MSSDALRLPFPRGAYPEREDPVASWLDRQGERFAAPFLRRVLALRRRGERVVRQAGLAAAELEDAGDAALRERSTALRVELRRSGFRDVLVARSFALVREAARRTIGERPYDVQLLGAWALLRGMVAEMETGEGKTLTATLPASTAALAGVPVHVITVNDYLVGRDAGNMAPIYAALGLSVGSVTHAATPRERRGSYACDVTYVSNKEVAFDYLKDRLTLGPRRQRAHLQLERLRGGELRADRLLLRGLCYGIVDEADSVLVDEARTPLIISRPGEAEGLEAEVYRTAIAIARDFEEPRDFGVDRAARRVRLTPLGEARIRRRARTLGGLWSGRHRAEELVTQALCALRLYRRDQHYLVAGERIQIVDEYTGRVLPDRSWERGLHQMIEAKEGLAPTGQVHPLARISYQRFFRRYLRLAGMTGTAREVADELFSIYGLPTLRVPTHRPLRRSDWGERVFRGEEERWAAVVRRIRELHEQARPALVGTRSVAASERLSDLLRVEGLPHQVLNARQDAEEAQIIARAGEAGRITVATNMAGRGTDIRLAPGVAEAGGLHVIATERHEARRIDRQLVGRAGRQGDPGSFEICASLEDEMVRAHGRLGSAWLEGLAERAGPTSRLRRWRVRYAQWRAERLHARMRRELLRMDERVSTLLAFSGKGE